MKIALLFITLMSISINTAIGQETLPIYETNDDSLRTASLAHIQLADGSEVFVSGAITRDGGEEYTVSVFSSDGTANAHLYSSRFEMYGALTFLAETNDNYFYLLNRGIRKNARDLNDGRNVAPLEWDSTRRPDLIRLKKRYKRYIYTFARWLKSQRRQQEDGEHFLRDFFSHNENHLKAMELELAAIEALIVVYDDINAGIVDQSQKTLVTKSVAK